MPRGRGIGGPAVWVAPSVQVAIEEEAYFRYPLETGGVLLGYTDARDPDSILVSAEVGPGPDATHRRTRFEPDSDWQLERIAEIYSESDRIVTYLGDWHSHPAGTGRPSRLDRRTARRIARTARARAPRPLMLIAHGVPGEWDFTVFRWRWPTLRRVRLNRD